MTMRQGGLHGLLMMGCAVAALCLTGGAQAPPASGDAGPVEAAPPVAPVSAEVAARVETLLQQLGHENWLVRQTAQDELVLLGAEARPRIEALLRETSDEEIRTRLEAALQQMEENRVTGTTLVTLHAAGLHPRTIFNELARQSHARFRTVPADLWESRQWPPLDCDAERQPFWTVMKDLCDRAGVAPAGGGSDGLLVLAATGPRAGPAAPASARGVERAWGSAPTLVSGPFLVAVSNISRSHHVDLAAPKNVTRDVRLVISVYPEPKLRILQGAPAARITEAIDDKGNSILSSTNFSTYMQTRSDWVWNLNAALRPHPQTGNRIALLKGSGRFIVQTRSDSAEVDGVMSARGQTRAIGGRRFTLKELRRGPDGESYVAALTLYRAGWTQNEWNYMGSYNNNTFRLLDAQGRPLARVYTPPEAGGSAAKTEISVTFRRHNTEVPGGELAGEPAKLVWEVPTETRELPVEFEFKDLPLP
jgi:hypothetical protein